MRIVRYIFALLSLFCMWSCSYHELPDVVPEGNGIRIVPRVMPFGEVDTKANKIPQEQKISSQAIAIFNKSKECIYFRYSSGESFVINPDNLAAAYSGLDACTVYAFANIPVLEEWAADNSWKTKTEDDFLSVPVMVEGVGIPEDGFPMMGVRNGVNLDPEGTVEYLISVEMVCAYAKFVVNIGVKSDLDIFDSSSSYFFPEYWEVHNVASSVDFDETTTPDISSESFRSYSFTGSQATSKSQVSFTFYLPERLLEPDNVPFDYPFADAGGNIREEDENLRQRYKPDLVSESQQATYVSVCGTFNDHQGHRKTVTYNLYVGENNYDDFNVRRNIQYNNNVTIKSAKKNSVSGGGSQVDFENTVSYDGRVYFTPADYLVRLERETILDAHWEIRPLRINIQEGSVNIRIKEPASTPWIRMENADKRQYFTTDLVTSTLSGNTEYTLDEPGEHCIWLYVDENTSQTKDDFRTAVITISHTKDGETVSLDYTIAQRYLYPITYQDRNYSIEYHEEYLYNYDSKDQPGMTEFEGMPWGLENVPLSKEYKAIVFDTGGGWISDILDDFINSNVGKVSPYYDFYLPRDIGTNSALTARSYSGYTFVTEIRETLQSSDETADFGDITLYDDPRSAIEYCYNKNKRNASGEVESMNWYLPAIDEMEEIAIGGYGVFVEFQNKYYWSCQPAYIQSRAHYHNLADEKGSYYTDDYGYYYVQKGEGKPADRQVYDGPGYARATKVIFSDGQYSWAFSGVEGYQDIFEIPGSGDPKVYVVPNKYNYTYWWSSRSFEEKNTLQRQEGCQPRTKQNRVRCVYKAD